MKRWCLLFVVEKLNTVTGQIFLLSALLIAWEELVLWFLAVIYFALPAVEFIFDRFVILPVDEHTPRFFPFELLVAWDRVACVFDREASD